jgi:hypothetical protein
MVVGIPLAGDAIAPATARTDRTGEMTKLRGQFGAKQWKKCCGKGCKKCDIHNAYIDEFGKKAGEKQFQKDREKMH